MKPKLIGEAELEALYDEENKGRCCVVREDFLAGARAALEELGVGLVMEIADRKSWTACPIREDEEDECGAFHAMFPLEGVDLPTTCPVGTGDDSAVSPNCPMFTIGAVLVRQKVT